MTYPPSCPLRKIRVTRRREKSPILVPLAPLIICLLLLWLLLLWLLLSLSGLLLLTSGRLLSLLAVQHQKDEGRSQTNNDETLKDAVVQVTKVPIAARHIIVVQRVISIIWIVQHIVLQKVGNPLTQRPILGRGCDRSASPRRQ